MIHVNLVGVEPALSVRLENLLIGEGYWVDNVMGGDSQRRIREKWEPEVWIAGWPAFPFPEQAEAILSSASKGGDIPLVLVRQADCDPPMGLPPHCVQLDLRREQSRNGSLQGELRRAIGEAMDHTLLDAGNVPIAAQTVELPTNGRPRGDDGWSASMMRPLIDHCTQIEQLRVMTDDLAGSCAQAEAAEREAYELMAMLSHEVRTPLTSILGYAEVLMADAAHATIPPTMLDSVRIIHREGERLLELVNGVLDMSAARVSPVGGPTDCILRSLADEVLEVFELRAQKKGLWLVARIAAAAPSVIRVDQGALRQVLINLIGNALKYTDFGGVTISIDVVQGEDRGPHNLKITVEDTGPGIAREDHERLFDPFVRLADHCTCREAGAGLGLAICSKLVKRLGGEMSLNSEVGEGSRFQVNVPVEVVPAISSTSHSISSARIPREQAKPRPGDAAGPLRGRVLLVDDDAFCRKLFERYLESAALTVHMAVDGYAALRSVARANRESRPYDLVLLDTNMPRMDGHRAVSLMRQHGYDMPIVAVTASPADRDRTACLEAGCNDVLVKPFNKEQLVALVRRYLPHVTDCTPVTPISH